MNDLNVGVADKLMKNKKAADASQDATSAEIMNNYVTNPGGGFVTFGTPDQKSEIAANLSQVGAQTGQNLFQTGQQQQDYYGSLQNRRNGGDAVANFMLGQRNRNMANVGRSIAGRKVGGGVAAAAMNSAQNSADKSVASQMQGFGRQNDQDLFNYVKRQQKVEGNAMSSGKDAGLAADISTDSGQGITVICGEMHRQGLMSPEIYAADVKMGVWMEKNDPYALLGYMAWATYVVILMQKSTIFSKCISFFGMAWARNMAGESNFLGSALMTIGRPVCRIIGKIVYKVSYAPLEA